MVQHFNVENDFCLVYYAKIFYTDIHEMALKPRSKLQVLAFFSICYKIKHVNYRLLLLC